MDSKARKEDYEKSANEYWRWIFAAEDLLIAANILEKEYKLANERIKDQKSGKLPLEFQVLAPMIYFKAKSIELFLKAIYIKNGSKVTKNGRFTYGTHDLNFLSKKISLIFDDEQNQLLKKLSSCIMYWGTYPIPLKVDDWRPPMSGIKGIDPIYSWGENDDNNYISILERVRKECPLPENKEISSVFKNLS